MRRRGPAALAHALGKVEVQRRHELPPRRGGAAEAQPSPQPVELVYAPTPQPQEETDDEPQYEAGVFDCDHHGNPVQVLREDDDEPYRVVELDASSGEYNLLYEMDYLTEDTHVNAVAMHSDGEGGYTALASIGGRKCASSTRAARSV